VRILLDTHAFLWFNTDDPKLSPNAKSLIEDPGNHKLLSVAVGFEIAIKSSLGKLTLAEPIDFFLERPLAKNDWSLLGIEVAHLATLSKMEFHHRDPFDRLLVAQSFIEDIPLISTDEILDAYDITRQW